MKKSLERIVNHNPTVNVHSIPSVSEDELCKQERMNENLPSQGVCYVYVRSLEKYPWLIDIYFWKWKKHDLRCRRFCIIPGYEMEEKEEKRFLKAIRNAEIHYEDELTEAIWKVAPELSLEDCVDAGDVLYNAYFMSHKCIRGLLLQHGLWDLEFLLDGMEEINLVADTPEGVFEMPLSLICKLNHDEGAKRLCSKFEREKICRIYKEYTDILNSLDILYPCQIDYLWECMRYGVDADENIVKELSYDGGFLIIPETDEDDFPF